MEMPAMEAPEGVTPNFVDPPNRNGMVNGVLTMFTVISTLCICLRMYAKVYVMRKMQLQESKAPAARSMQHTCNFRVRFVDKPSPL